MIIYLLLGIGFLFALAGLCIGWASGRRMADAPLPLTPASLEDNYFSLELDDPESEVTPYLSVIVYAFDRSDSIGPLVEALSTQRTEFPYEIIFVCNATARETAAIAERFANRPGIRFTFIPPESHNLSRRKLAFTVGIKAAGGEVVLLTGSNMGIPSAGWFQLMAAPFRKSEETGLVLGTTRFSFAGMSGILRRYRQYLFVMGKCQSLGSALAGNPYRGDWGNMAMRRSLFFDRKGFASTINIETGDDDLFVYQASQEMATEVVLSPAAMPESRWGDGVARIWNEQRTAYDFTRRWLPRKPFLKQGLLSVSQWGVMLFAVAAGILPFLFVGNPLLSLPFAWIGAAAGGVLWVGFELIQIVFYRHAASRLAMPRLFLTYPLFALWRPIGNMIFRMTHREAARHNYTWVR